MQIEPPLRDFTAALAFFDFYPFIGNFCDLFWLFLFTEEEEGGSAYLHLVFMRQRLGVRFVSPAPSSDERNGWIEGPARQVKWDTGVFLFSSLPLRFARHWMPPFKRILHYFFAESIDSFCILVRGSVSLIVLHSSPLLLLVDMWPGALELDFASILHLDLSRMH